MFHFLLKCLIVVIFCVLHGKSVGLELFSSVAVGISSSLYAGLTYLYDKDKERCDSKWIINDFAGLADDFQNNLYGQHLVSNIVLRSLRNHLRNDKPKKALVMSFHGRTGGGKNHVANMTANRIFKKGSKSIFFKLWVTKLHLVHPSKTAEYQDEIQYTIRKMVEACPRSMFVFDEADELAPGLIDALKPFLDYHEHLDWVDYRKATFIFLSNTGSSSIAQLAYSFWKTSRDRESITMKEIEPIVKSRSFHEKGGLHHTSLTKNSLIDAYVPFLPLEKRHVILCIRDYLMLRGCRDVKRLTDMVAESFEYEPPDFYSMTGCKLIESKVNYLVDDECD